MYLEVRRLDTHEQFHGPLLEFQQGQLHTRGHFPLSQLRQRLRQYLQCVRHFG